MGGQDENATAGNAKAKVGRLFLIGVFVGMIVGLVVATQYAAYRFGYPESLGWNVRGVYLPISFVGWYMRWYSASPEIFDAAMTFGVGAAGFIAFVAFLMVSVHSNSATAHTTLYGTARWSKRKDIVRMGFLPVDPHDLSQRRKGVCIGAFQNKKKETEILYDDSKEHVIVVAPTRSGKGVGPVNITLLSWEESVLVYDLKGELWALTAGWRKKYAKQVVMRFNPASVENTVRWNPFDEIRIGTPYEWGDVQNIALLIIDPDGHGLDGHDGHWKKTATSLITGSILHCIYKARREGKIASLATLDDMLSDPEKPLKTLWEEMKKYPHFEDDTTHKEIAKTGADMLNRSENEMTSILSTVKSALFIYRDPVLAKNISRSEFSLRDLMHHENPVSLYIVIQPADKERLRPLTRILFSMTIRLLADEQGFKEGRAVPSYKHKLLTLIDEFPSLGKMDIVQDGLSWLAGFGIKFMVIAQDLSQLQSESRGYGRDESITANCKVRVFFPPGKLETAKYISELLGNKTEIKREVTVSGKRGAAFQNQMSETVRETGKPLLNPAQVMALEGPEKNANGDIVKPGKMLICVYGHPPIMGIQPLFFNIRAFAVRATIAAEETDRVKRDVTVEEPVVI